MWFAAFAWKPARGQTHTALRDQTDPPPHHEWPMKQSGSLGHGLWLRARFKLFPAKQCGLRPCLPFYKYRSLSKSLMIFWDGFFIRNYYIKGLGTCESWCVLPRGSACPAIQLCLHRRLLIWCPHQGAACQNPAHP